MHTILTKPKCEVYQMVVLPVAVHVIVIHVTIIFKCLRSRALTKDERSVCC